MPTQEGIEVRLKSPLWKGNHFTFSDEYGGYHHHFGSHAGPVDLTYNLQALQKLVQYRPSVLADLRHVENGYDMVPYDQADQVTLPRRDPRNSYRLIEEGLFKIPWLVRARVSEGSVFVDYRVRALRPNLSVAYQLEQSQRAEFMNPPQGDMLGDSRKKRTRVDGLPVYLRVNAWQTDAWHYNYPTNVTLFRRSVREQRMPVQEGAKVEIRHVDTFRGFWDETWYTWEEGNNIQVDKVEIELQGNWVT